MRLINQSFEILMQEDGLQGIFKQIEKAARVSYKSEDKITEDSAEKFVKEVLLKRGHLAPLEHGTVYLTVPYDYYNKDFDIQELSEFYYNNPYSKVIESMNLNDGYPCNEQMYYITTNYRVLLENGRLDDLKYMTPPGPNHSLRVSVRLITSRGITHELVRHRKFSFMQESTRFCNYSQSKFNSEITFIIPCWYSLKEGYYQYIHETGPLGHDFYWSPEVSLQDLENGAGVFLDSLAHSEAAYHEVLNKWRSRIHDRRYRTGYEGNPLTPQQARELLPNALKSEIIMTGFLHDWIGGVQLLSPRTHLFHGHISNASSTDLEKYKKDWILVKYGVFAQRCSPEAHPMMQSLMNQVRQAFIDKGLMKYDDL